MPDLGCPRDHSPSPTPPPETASPYTPARNSQDKSPFLHRQNGTATPNFSPLASPSLMSLPSLGMSPFSPLQRPFSPLQRQVLPPFVASTPSSRPGTAQSSRSGLVRASKVSLVQRLHALAAKLDQEDCEEDEGFDKLHTMMNRMEKAFSSQSQRRGSGLGSPKHPKPGSGKGSSSSNATRNLHTPEKPMYDRSSPLSSTNPSPSSGELDRAEVDGEIRPGHATRMSVVEAERVATEAQSLCRELEAVATSLRARQEESEHIHDLLIMRAERAAQHIIYLEKRVQELENERNENEMEILNLQFQLKAIEVQCLSYVPKDADQDLRESISAWKTEWSALKRKRARKKDYADAGSSGSPQNHARATGSTSQKPTPKSSAAT